MNNYVNNYVSNSINTLTKLVRENGVLCSPSPAQLLRRSRLASQIEFYFYTRCILY